MAHLFVSCLCWMWDLDMTLKAAKLSEDDLDLQDYGDGKWVVSSVRIET